MASTRVLATDLEFAEGPVVMPDGSVVLVEIRGQRLTRVWPDGRKEVVAKMPGGPNGAALGPDAARAEVGVPHLGVAHLPGRQPDGLARGFERAVGIPGQQALERRRLREGDGVLVALGADAPAVEDDECERTCHRLTSTA